MAKQQSSLRVDSVVYEKVARLAADERRSIAEQATLLLEIGLAYYRPTNPTEKKRGRPPKQF